MTQPEREGTNIIRDFSLGKYYVDFVTSEGHFFIGYSAQMNWRGIDVNYRATIHHPSIHGVKSGPSLSGREAPVHEDASLIWNTPKLGFDCRWRPLSPPFSYVLHKDVGGFVEWNCLQPSARTQMTTSSGAKIEALGYVEYLNMTIFPWRLGLQTLLWGRFVSEQHAVVWIEWRGDLPLILLVCDGRRIDDPKISNHRVVCDDFELSFKQADTIRMGSIGEALVSKLPAVLKTAPVEFLGGREEKYVSLGKLTHRDGSSHTGWVIYERVSWGRSKI